MGMQLDVLFEKLALQEKLLRLHSDSTSTIIFYRKSRF